MPTGLVISISFPTIYTAEPLLTKSIGKISLERLWSSLHSKGRSSELLEKVGKEAAPALREFNREFA
jgi:hypothetical protein